MTQTRVDNPKLIADGAKAAAHIGQAFEILRPYLAVMTDEERAQVPRAPAAYAAACLALARALADYPKIAAAVNADPAAIREDVANVAALASLTEKVAELAQQLADTRLEWQAEAWTPSLAAYNVAKVAARQDGKLRTVVDPIAEVFASRRARAAEQQTPVDK